MQNNRVASGEADLGCRDQIVSLMLLGQTKLTA